jgi:hypothetical protein
VITRMKVYNRTGKTVKVDPKYRRLFHGNTEVPYGEHEIRYLIRDITMNRLVTSLQIEYPMLKVKEGVAGYEVI